MTTSRLATLWSGAALEQILLFSSTTAKGKEFSDCNFRFPAAVMIDTPYEI